MKTIRNFNIDGPRRKRVRPEEVDLSFLGDRDIVRNSETPMQAGNVGGSNIKDFLENYFFNDKPLFVSASIFLATPIATPSGTPSGQSYLINGFSVYIEHGYFYQVILQVTITPNDEEDITLRHIEDGTGAEVYSFNSNTDSYTINNYHSVNRNFKAKMSVSDNSPGYTVKSSNRVYVYSITSMIWGISSLDDLTGFNPYTNGFTRKFMKVSPGSSFDIVWETDQGYHYVLIPDSFPPLTNVSILGFSQKGSWNNLNPWAVLTIEDTNANVLTASVFKVYRTSLQMIPTIGNPITYTFTF